MFDDIGHETDEIPNEDSFFNSSLQNDLFISVADPKKHVETMETYITYKLSTKVCFTSGSNSLVNMNLIVL